MELVAAANRWMELVPLTAYEEAKLRDTIARLAEKVYVYAIPLIWLMNGQDHS